VTEPARVLARLIDGYLSTQLLHVAASLGVPDALAGGPAGATELAAKVGARPEPLRRVLRGLAAERVLDELPDGRFALTPIGTLLVEGAPGSMRGAALARGELYYAAVGALLDAVVDGPTPDGTPPFELVHGEPFFAHLAARPDRSAAFRASMAARSAREATAVVAAYDFARFRRLVDVGGGPGVLLRAILAATPGLDGLLFDRPEVVADASLPALGGDFFAAVPEGADAYLLSRVIHDWPDADAAAVLGSCRRAMPTSATLLLVEAVLPERAADDPEAIRMDLHMLALLGGRERTETEFAALLAGAGFVLDRVLPTAAGVSVLEAHRDNGSGDDESR
jgi:O-methyltransferase domain/Dimerisation domain